MGGTKHRHNKENFKVYLNLLNRIFYRRGEGLFPVSTDKISTHYKLRLITLQMPYVSFTLLDPRPR